MRTKQTLKPPGSDEEMKESKDNRDELIAFRVKEKEYLELLDSNRAAGENRNAAARRILRDFLHRDFELQTVHEEIASLSEMYMAFERKFQISVEALLVGGGKCTKEQANAWVKDKLCSQSQSR